MPEPHAAIPLRRTVMVFDASVRPLGDFHVCDALCQPGCLEGQDRSKSACNDPFPSAGPSGVDNACMAACSEAGIRRPELLAPCDDTTPLDIETRPLANRLRRRGRFQLPVRVNDKIACNNNRLSEETGVEMSCRSDLPDVGLPAGQI